MKNYLQTILMLASTQLKRNLRDPITTIVLFGIPVLLLLVFGALIGNTDNISLRVAVVNQSNHGFAKNFEETLDKVEVLKQPDESLNFEQARDKMKDSELDGIILLPDSFGDTENDQQNGELKLYFDASDTQTGDIVAGVMRGIVDQTNQQITGSAQPIQISRETINVNASKPIDHIFSMFTAMAILMVGVFGVASSIPADKKSGILRRLHVTPMKASQLLGGTMLAFGAIALLAVIIMTVLAITVFNLNMHGEWTSYSLFILASTVLMLGFGLAIASIAKNSTQADIFGQVVFLASLAVSGVWFPRALMPEWLQNITFAMPLTPVIDGIKGVVSEGLSITQLGPELAVIGIWTVVLYFIGAKFFKWA